MNVSSNEINTIKYLFEQEEKTVAEISDQLAMSRQNVKRALAEAGLMTLSWYKTKEEIYMLNYLRGMGIKTLKELRGVL